MCVAFREFQYISCCSLSNLLSFCLYSFYYFNTSHVVVYLSRNLQRIYVVKFQYISCCSLSYQSHSLCNRLDRFQYISCCSLSFPKSKYLPTLSYFNTSHVVVYQRCEYEVFGNTLFQYISCCSLSINCGNPVAVKWKFQYISCCSLSCRPSDSCGLLLISIHLML